MIRTDCSSGGLFKPDDRQMLPSFQTRHDELELYAVLASCFVEYGQGSDLVIDFLRCPAAQGLMNPELVIPRDVEAEFISHLGQPEGNENRSGTFRLHGTNESLDDGDTAILSDGAISPLDFPPLRPCPKGRAVELTAPVGPEDRRLSSGPPVLDVVAMPAYRGKQWERCDNVW
jgi:hypothetical protein